MTIATEAGSLMASSVVQTAVNCVYSGSIMFSNVATPFRTGVDYAIKVYDQRATLFLGFANLTVPPPMFVLCVLSELRVCLRDELY